MSASLAYSGAGSTVASRSGSWFLRIMGLLSHIACQNQNLLLKQGKFSQAGPADRTRLTAGVNFDRPAAVGIGACSIGILAVR
jgi:hypothetical protein